jgi:hypothetical protein
MPFPSPSIISAAAEALAVVQDRMVLQVVVAAAP